MSFTARSPIVVAFKTLLIFTAAVALGSARESREVPTQFNEFTVAQLQDAMSHGRITSEGLTRYYIDRIFALDQNGPGVNAVIELNPDAIELAENADALRRGGATAAKFPLLGIPLLLKDNIDTGDRMQTTAGSFSLAGLPAVQDSTVAAKLRARARSFWARRTCPSGRTSARHTRRAAGPGAAASPTIPIRSIATRADPVRGRARRRQQTSPRSRSAAKPTAASCVREA
jgi:hypothetical protein